MSQQKLFVKELLGEQETNLEREKESLKTTESIEHIHLKESEVDSANVSGTQALTLRLVIEPPECCAWEWFTGKL